MADIQKIAQKTYDDNQTSDQFGVSQVGFHTHNGSDSPVINFKNLTNKIVILTPIVVGSSAATNTNYGVFFTAPFTCMFTHTTEVHSVKGTDAGAVTLQIEKLIGTQATGAGVNLLGTPFDLKGTINTVQTGILAIVTQKTFTLNKGDRLGLSLTGTPTSLSQVVLTVQLEF